MTTSFAHPKVLHIASGDLWAGAEVQLFTLLKTLHSKFGVAVHTILLNHGELELRLRDQGIPVIIIDESRLNSIQMLRRIVDIIQSQRPDIVHTHRLKENILGSIAAFLAGQVPSLRTTHGNPKHSLTSLQVAKRGKHLLNTLCGRLLQSRIIAVSEDLSKILEKDYPISKLRVIENGIDLDALYATTGEQERVAYRPGRALHIGIAGRLVPVKRVDLFIQIARYMREHYPGLETAFHIFGDGPLRSELGQFSIASGTDSIVTFEGHCNDIPQRLRTLDLLLMTSDHEGLPMILLEAMALRVPVIAHAVGGIPQLLDHGTCGVLVHEHNAPGYAQAIIRLANDPQKQNDITQKAHKRIIQHYSAERNARAYLSEYNAILKRNALEPGVE